MDENTGIENAKELINSKDYYGAISLLKDLIVQEPDNWKLYYEISKCYYKMENSDRALYFLKSAEKYATQPDDIAAVKGIIDKILNPPEEKKEEAENSQDDKFVLQISPVVKVVNEYRERLINSAFVYVSSIVPGGGLLLLGKYIKAFLFFGFSILFLTPLIKKEYLVSINNFVFPKIEEYLNDYLNYYGDIKEFYPYWIYGFGAILIILYINNFISTKKALLYKNFVCVIRDVLQENDVVFSIGKKDGVAPGNRFKICRIIIQGDTISGTYSEPPFGRVKHIGFARIYSCEESISFAKYEFIESNMVIPEKDDIAFRIE